jgi:hypothetical protein
LSRNKLPHSRRTAFSCKGQNVDLPLSSFMKKLRLRVPPARIIEAVCLECKCEKEKVV